MNTTKNHMQTNATVITQPRICSGYMLKDLATANVALTKAVCGKT